MVECSDSLSAGFGAHHGAAAVWASKRGEHENALGGFSKAAKTMTTHTDKRGCLVVLIACLLFWAGVWWGWDALGEFFK